MDRRLALLDKFATIHLLVIGDLMLDRFIWGEVDRLSPEAPVPVLRVVSEESSLGGAANVVQNIRALGGRVTACGIVGRDDAGRRVLQALRNAGASIAGVVSDKEFETIQKSRIIASPHHQQIVRLDRESRRPIGRRTLGKMREFVASNAARYHGIIISDYGKGVIHEELLQHVAAAAAREKIVTIVDPKKENYDFYRFPTLITPNKSEASEASGIAIHDENSLCAAGKKLVRKWRAQAVLITRGAEGMSLFRRRVAPKHFPTEPKDVFDVTGAGDTVVAMCALGLASGAGFDDTAVLANVAAGFVGDEIGTVAVPAAKIKKVIEDRDR
ncbi:MAG TPA: D-glycero-beta-D-manno-heptose-7-phosphate kinase [Candidatus Binatia bacterium]